jgi:hypothetical protein
LHLTSHTARAFLKAFLLVAAAGTVACAAFIALLDPFGVLLHNSGSQRPIMDINQRYMYPQVVRSQRFDSVVIGTSTSRLLDPVALDAAFGGQFANLAMNAATAWEQTEVLKLVQRHLPAPKTVVLGIDDIWCLDEKNLVKKTFRGFPGWMYDTNRWNDLPQLFNLTTLEIAGRLLGFHLGLMPERIRRDGYEVFTPPEQTYDLARARFHIWGKATKREITPVVPPVVLGQERASALSFPALVWLDERLAALPRDTRKLLVYMPVHVAAQPVPGSVRAAEIAVCKARIEAIASRHNSRIVDFSLTSSLTTGDKNYWDPLHYRLPVAETIVRGLKAASETGQSDAEGLYRVR